MSGPLAGLRVMDLCMFAAGPWTGALLGQLGAEVIKVEPPVGDPTGQMPPTQRGVGANYLCLNVNKRAAVLDLKAPGGYQAALKLAATSDVFLQNFRGGVIDRLGLGYAKLSELNPRLVYCSITGFGEYGPLGEAGCADYIMQAFSGFARLNGTPGSTLEQFRFSGFLDVSTSIVATEAILAALLERESSGRGQKVEVSMLQASLEMQMTRIAEFLAAKVPPCPLGSESPALVPDRGFQTMDREVFVTVHDAAQWRGFCVALGQPDLAADPRFATNAERVEHRAELNALLEPIFLKKPALWWLRTCQRNGVPCGLAEHFESIRYHSQVVRNGMILELDTPHVGRVVVGGLPWHFSETECEAKAPRPAGADTAAVLAELGVAP